MTHEELLATANVALIFAEVNSEREAAIRAALHNYCHAHEAACDTSIEPAERAKHVTASHGFARILRDMLDLAQ